MPDQPAARPAPTWAADCPKLREATDRHNRALDNGVTKEALVEVITHETFYSGWPTGVQGAAS
jgi:alkylhydroperoxidase/carboxymuconolactone decarboxylase family protein YurZ